MKKFVLAAMTALALVVPAAASAQSPIPEIGYANVLGPIHASDSGTEARLHVRYSCSSGEHLWVSVKQSASGAVNPAIEAESSGENHVSATWLDSHRNSVICDGRAHQDWFIVDQVEPGKYGALVRGKAWVQFCVTDENIPTNFGLVTYHTEWSKVV
jgi:hypothetical protein